MKLRTQILLCVLPLFLAVGLLGAFLRYSTEEVELRWGLKEEAEGYAYALRPVLEGVRWSQLGSDAEARNDHVHRLEQIMTLGRVRRVVGISADRGTTLFDLAAESAEKPKLIIEDETLQNVRIGQNWTSTPAQGENVRSFLPVKDADGTIVGALGIEIDSQDYWREVQELYQAVIFQAAWALVIGFVCALVIARVISKGIRRVELQSQAIQLAVPQKQEREGAQEFVQGSLLKELGDLSSGLRTMQSTMNDIQQRAHMDLFEREKFLLEEDLTRLLQTDNAEPHELEVDGVQILGCLAQSAVQGDFLRLFQAESGTYAVYGRVHGADLATRMRNASAAGRLSAELLARNSIEDTWDKIRHTFSFEYWTCIKLSLPLTTAECWEGRPDEKNLRRSETHAQGTQLLQHNLPTASGIKAERYVAVFHKNKPFEIKPELTAIVRETGRGALVFVGEA